ncbi:MAG: GNAT family N-acetyltransferase [Pseudomonadota bacterium]
MTIEIRPYRNDDLASLHAINVASEPGVGAVTEERLAEIISIGRCDVAVGEAGEALGFVLLHLPDADYDGSNFNWFADRYETFVYVDRIAIATDARGRKIGEQLYKTIFDAFSDLVPIIGCEVNSVPPNPASLRFHKRLGFEEVGAHTFEQDYAVTYLARRINR